MREPFGRTNSKDCTVRSKKLFRFTTKSPKKEVSMALKIVYSSPGSFNYS